jgi:hypothetical protein
MSNYLGDVFVMAEPIDNTENVKYYLMRCTEQKMRLLEDLDDNGFIYEK